MKNAIKNGLKRLKNRFSGLYTIYIIYINTFIYFVCLYTDCRDQTN